MKKIIATVLAMVMALALCTVAFATEKYEVVDVSAPTTKYDVKTVAVTNASTTTTDGVVSGTVTVYTVTLNLNATEQKYVESSKENATHILYKDGAIYKYLLYVTDKNATGKYDYVGEVYNTFGTKCGDMKKTDSTKESTFFTAKDGSKTTNYYVESTDGGKWLLVNNELVQVKPAEKPTDYTVVSHNFKKADGATYTYNTDGTLATAKCATCGAVYSYTTKYAVAAAAKDCITVDQNTGLPSITSGYLYTNDGTTTPSTGNTTSPKTFDAGIAMYVGMALTSVAGSAVVIGKKKEF